MKLKSRPHGKRGLLIRRLTEMRLFSGKPRRRQSNGPSTGAKEPWSLHRLLNRKAMQERDPAPVFLLVNTAKASACYELNATGASVVDQEALPKSGAVIYLFEGGDDERMKADLRLELPPKTSGRAAKEKVLEEINHRARMFRSSAFPTIIYGRDERTLAQFGENMVIPGPSLIDHLVPPNATQACIIPIELTDNEGGTLAVILCTVRPGDNGNATVQERLQLTRQPGVSIETLVAEFGKQAARKNNAYLKPQVLGPSQAELVSLARKLPFYPLENDVFGLPVSNLMRMGTAALAVAAAASIAGNVVMGLEAGYLDISANRAIAERDDLSRKIDQTLKSRMRALAVTTSIDIADTVKAAQAVWQPNALVTVDCTFGACTLQLTASVNRAGGIAGVDVGGQLVSSALDKETMSAMLMQAAPAGYRKREVAITGDGNVVTVVFEHKNPDTPARRLLPH